MCVSCACLYCFSVMEGTSCSLISKLLNISLTSEMEERRICFKREGATVNLLCGANSCGKTSLLFEYAFSCAVKGENVLYIAPKPLHRLPLFVNGRTEPNGEVLKRISMVYLANYDEIIEYFSNVHLDKVRNSPQGQSRHVLIDDFDKYFEEKGTRTEETTRFAKSMAYIIDGIDFWSKNMKSSVDTKCCVLLAETMPGDSMTVERLGLYKHWTKEYIKIQKLGLSLFRIQLVEHGNNMHHLSSKLVACYSIGDNGIKVEEGRVQS